MERIRLESIDEIKQYSIYPTIYRDSQSPDYKKLMFEEAKIYHNKDLSDKLISVIISTHNRVDILPRTICGILEQKYSNFEILVVDDSDNDETKKMILGLNLDNVYYYHTNQNYGGGLSKKLGYLNSKGDIVIFSDDDDYFVDNEYFDKLLLKFKNSDYTMVVSNTLSHVEDENIYILNKINAYDGITNSEYLTNFQYKIDKPTSMFPLALDASKIKSINYDELKFFGDTSLYLFGLLADGKIGVINDYIGVYRIQQNSVTGHSKSDFTVMNFDSKYDIFMRATKMNLIHTNVNKWLYKQIIVNMGFHFNSLPNPYSEDVKILKWCLRYMKGIYKLKLVFRFFAYRIRNKIKH